MGERGPESSGEFFFDTYPGFSGQRDPACSVDTIMGCQAPTVPEVGMCDPDRDDSTKAFLPHCGASVGWSELPSAPGTAFYG